MPQMTNGKRVLHKYIGSAQTFSDDTIWEGLTLGPNVKGYVVAKTDTTTKTVQLAGVIYPSTDIASNGVLVQAPQSWKFNFAKMPVALYWYSSGQSIGLTDYCSIQSDSKGNIVASTTFTGSNILVITQGTTGDVSKGYASFQSLFNNVSTATFPITFN